MSNQTSDNNKRIAKNTLFLYFRMLFMMAVSLYTSRVVLDALGIEDFGIYNVVGGFVAMFTFINTSMSSATERFLNYEMGCGNKKSVHTVFCTSVNIHSIISIVILILAETVGLWFLNTKMVIPESRMTAALWVYQLSIFSTVIMVMSVPYNALIIAHEKMGTFAYISVLEVMLKLVILYFIIISPFDRLIFYAFLMMLTQILIRFIYGRYCSKHFSESHYQFIVDKVKLKEMLGFAGWDLYGNMSVMARTQGVNVLLNLFFGPVVNAASGIATRVQAAIMGFAGNIIVAVRPQLIQAYSVRDYHRMNSLLIKGAFFIFLLLSTLSLPVIIETPYILQLWLKTVPDTTIVFCRLILLFNLIAAISSVVMIGIHATGRIKKSSFINGTLYCMVIPISYLFYKMGGQPELAYLINVIAVFIGMSCNIVYLHLYIPEFDVWNFVVKVIGRCMFIFALNSLILYALSQILEVSFMRLLYVCLISLVLSLSEAWLFMTKNERSLVTDKILSIWKKMH